MFSQLWAAFSYLANEGALGEASTTQRIFHEFRKEVSNFLNRTLLSSIHSSVLRNGRSEIYDGMDMRIHGKTISLG